LEIQAQQLQLDLYLVTQLNQPNLPPQPVDYSVIHNLNKLLLQQVVFLEILQHLLLTHLPPQPVDYLVIHNLYNLLLQQVVYLEILQHLLLQWVDYLVILSLNKHNHKLLGFLEIHNHKLLVNYLVVYQTPHSLPQQNHKNNFRHSHNNKIF